MVACVQCMTKHEVTGMAELSKPISLVAEPFLLHQVSTLRLLTFVRLTHQYTSQSCLFLMCLVVSLVTHKIVSLIPLTIVSLVSEVPLSVSALRLTS